MDLKALVSSIAPLLAKGDVSAALFPMLIQAMPNAAKTVAIMLQLHRANYHLASVIGQTSNLLRYAIEQKRDITLDEITYLKEHLESVRVAICTAQHLSNVENLVPGHFSANTPHQ
jgi:antitoxin component HigA of HigAB toxin-antitoxin module